LPSESRKWNSGLDGAKACVRPLRVSTAATVTRRNQSVSAPRAVWKFDGAAICGRTTAATVSPVA